MPTCVASTAVEPITRSQSAVIEPYRADGLIDTAIGSARRALDQVLALLPSGVAATSEVVVGSPARRAHRALAAGSISSSAARAPTGLPATCCSAASRTP